MTDCSCNHFPATLGNVTFDQGINVGIGLTNPGYRLTVSDGTKQTIAHFDINGAYIGTLTDDNFGLLTNGGVKLFITAAGNVGIGLTNPAYKLVVTDGTKQIIDHFDINGAYTGTLTNDNFGLLTNGGVKLFVTAGGDVGIGTSSPTGTLDVNGNIHASGRMVADGNGCYYA